MRRLLLAVAATLLGSFVVAGLVFIVGVRFRSPFVISSVRRFARITNRLPLKSAGHDTAYASVVVHTGRTSGRRYRTPVHAVPTDDGFVIALPYGSNSDWVRNMLASGGATLIHRGQAYQLVRPHVAPLREVETWFTAGDQRAHRLFGVTEALVARCAPKEGTVADRVSTAASRATS